MTHQSDIHSLCPPLSIRFTSKITIVSYIGTYYAIGAAWILTVINYFAIGWFNGYLDKYYLDSWKVWFVLVIVFVGLGNVSLAVMRYRLGEKTLVEAGWENGEEVQLLALGDTWELPMRPTDDQLDEIGRLMFGDATRRPMWYVDRKRCLWKPYEW